MAFLYSNIMRFFHENRNQKHILNQIIIDMRAIFD